MDAVLPIDEVENTTVTPLAVAPPTLKDMLTSTDGRHFIALDVGCGRMNTSTIKSSPSRRTHCDTAAA